MSHLRRRDYFSIIREQDLDVVLTQLEQTTALPVAKVLEQAEKRVIDKISANICHRYNPGLIFTDILTWSVSTQYSIGDLVQYSETAYSETATYSVNDLVSFQTTVGGVIHNDIYICIIAVSSPEVFVTAKWTKQAPNDSLYVVREPVITTKPGTNFSYTTNLFTGNHDTIKGWDTTQDLFFKRIDNQVKIYYSAANRTSDSDSIGVVDVTDQVKTFPSIIPITVGADRENQLSGDLAIIGFMPDGQEWGVVASNPFQLEDNRSQLILGIIIDLVLFDIHALINPRMIPELRGERKDDAMQLLKDIKKGVISPKLPLYHDETKGARILYGSEPRKEHTFFKRGTSGLY